MFENGAIRVKMLIFLTQINSMDIKVLFLTGHLLNMQKASPRHTHFKPLSENRGTHTVALQKRVYQPYFSPMTIHWLFFNTWQTTTKINFSNLFLKNYFFSTFNLFFDSEDFQEVWGDCTELCLRPWLLCTLNLKPETLCRFWFWFFNFREALKRITRKTYPYKYTDIEFRKNHQTTR